MLHRDKQFKRPAETIREEITLAPGETKESRFKAWLTEKLAAPRLCPRHQQTRLVYDRNGSGVWPAREGWYHPLDHPKERPGVFIFLAELRCPACRCAYALCPPEFHTKSFKTFDTSTPEHAEKLARCQEFAAQVNTHDRGMALFVGPTGPGKTRLACNIVRELDNPDALYVRQGQLTTELRATYNLRQNAYSQDKRIKELAIQIDAFEETQPDLAARLQSELEVLQRQNVTGSANPLEIVQAVRFLVLDEIGCAPLANDERLLLDELLKHRYDQAKPTILISNLALDQLKEFLGDALTDRIRSATGNGKFILQFSGESFRRTTGEDYLMPPD